MCIKKGYIVGGFLNEDGTKTPHDPTKADKVKDATNGNFAALDNEGNLKDSGKKASDFALANHNHDNTYAAKDHYHDQLFSDSEYHDYEAGIYCGSDANINISVADHVEGKGGEVDIDSDNIGNLWRALKDPAAPAEDGDVLITNGQVYTALEGKANVEHGHKSIQHARRGGGGAVTDTASVETGYDDSSAFIKIQLTHAPLPPQKAFITPSNINNLKKALDGPEDGLAEDSTKLVTSGDVYDALVGATTVIQKTYDGESAIDILDDINIANHLTYIVTIGGSSSVSILDLFVAGSEDILTAFGSTTTFAVGKTIFVEVYKVSTGYILHVTGVYDTSSAVVSEPATPGPTV